MELRTNWLRAWLLVVLTVSVVGCKGREIPKGHAPQGKRISAYKAMTRTRAYWPNQGWKTKTPAELGIRKDALDKAFAYAFQRTGDEINRKGIRTDGVVVIYRGYLVKEQYARKYKANTSHLAWSMTKSFVNALYGRAIKEGLVSLDDTAAKYIKEIKDSLMRKVTIRQLLNMTSGLCWNEGYEASPLKSTVIKMLYTAGRDDMGGFAVKQGMCFQPATHWYYSSGTSNLLMKILSVILKKKYHSYPWTHLFDVLGMKNVTWERDASGNFVGSSYLHASPRQLAKFGFLYLNDGVWNGKRLFPADWVHFTDTVPAADPLGIYGAHWWLNVGRPEKNVRPRFPNAPRDTMVASGHWGQFLFVIPSLDLVVVRMGDDREKAFNRNTFLKLLIASLPSQPRKQGGSSK